MCVYVCVGVAEEKPGPVTMLRIGLMLSKASRSERMLGTVLGDRSQRFCSSALCLEHCRSLSELQFFKSFFYKLNYILSVAILF